MKGAGTVCSCISLRCFCGLEFMLCSMLKGSLEEALQREGKIRLKWDKTDHHHYLSTGRKTVQLRPLNRFSSSSRTPELSSQSVKRAQLSFFADCCTAERS